MKEREDSSEVKRVAADILHYLHERPNEEVTYAHLAKVTNSGGHFKTTFKLAMRRARGEALAHGGQITTRQWSSELGVYTVSYLPVPAPHVRSEPEMLTDLYVRLRRFSQDAAVLHGMARAVPGDRATAQLLSQAMSSLDEALNTAVMATDLAFRESERLCDRTLRRAARPEADGPELASAIAS